MSMTSGETTGQGRESISNQVVPCIWDGRRLGTVNLEAFRHPDDKTCALLISHSIGAGAERVILHWGVTLAPDGAWVCPPSGLWPTGTAKAGDHAVETELPASQPLKIVVPGDGEIFNVKFVVKRVLKGNQEQWFNSGNGDFCVACKLPDASLAGRRVLHDEAQSGFSIYNRYCMVMDLLDPAQSDEDIMAWLYVVLRFHHLKLLRWYGSYNYQSKDIAHLQDTLSRRMALAATYAPNPKSRLWARRAMAFLSRGGGLSEEIRMQVLGMMRRHGIREGHRPGIEDRFLEQWHQKLHQNSTPEDIVICEAYLHFLHTGKEGDFWHVLWERGGITRERLASMRNPITACPLHLPQLIPDLQHYLWTLKTVHAGADLHFMIESGKWALEKAGDREAIGWLYEINNNFHAWWIPGKIAQTRGRLKAPLKNVYAAERDMLLLDAALDRAFKTAVERIDIGSLNGDSLVDLLELVLSQASLARNDDPEYEGCLRQWRAQVKNAARWGSDWALRAVAAAHRLSLLLAHEAQETAELLQGKAVELGQAAGVPKQQVANFSEEVVRGQSAFSLSLLLHRLDPMLRRAAGLGRWNLVSLGSQHGSATGRARFVASLGEVQAASFSEPTVLVVDRVNGTDDIPSGTSAVLAGGSVDVLSHVGIRARNQGVILACGEPELLTELRSRFHDADPLSVQVPVHDLDGNLEIRTSPPPRTAPATRSSKARSHRLAVPEAMDEGMGGSCQTRLVGLGEFRPGLVGAKSCSLARLASALPSWLATPKSLALPLGSMEMVLSLAENAPAARAVQLQAATAADALAAGDMRSFASALTAIRREVVCNVKLDDELESALQQVLQLFRQPASRLQGLQEAVRRVWASKWTERACLSRAKAGLPDAELFMGVLMQEIVPAEYAFVLHTANPLTRDDSTLLGEVVIGLGETLAGNHPGRAFSFTVPRVASASGARILSYPSKPTAWFADPNGPGLIARSDSNGEDLEELAGAGLYDSVMCGSIREEPMDYVSCPLTCDESFRRRLIEKLRLAGLEVEKAMGGGAQDIEGVVREDRVTIVQTRPQVGMPQPHAQPARSARRSRQPQDPAALSDDRK